MVISFFPPLESGREDGLLAVGGDLDPESLVLAYESGIFPWPHGEESPLLWFSPPRRAVLFFDDFRVSRSLRRSLKKTNCHIRVNCNFEGVITSCASSENRKGAGGTWISEPIVEAYVRLHKLGIAHSVECYRDDELLGGLYGVCLRGMFAGESMFYRADDASKFCLVFLVHYLASRGVKWLDCQQSTPLLESFGACELERADFIGLLAKALSMTDELFRGLDGRLFPLSWPMRLD